MSAISQAGRAVRRLFLVSSLLLLTAGLAPAAEWWDGFDSSGLGGAGMDKPVYCLSPYGTDLVAGGAFGTAGQSYFTYYLASWNGSAWSAFSPSPVLDGFVRAVLEYDGDLIVGGEFNNVQNDPMDGLVLYDGSSWSAIGGSDVQGGITRAMIEFNGDLIVGGGFPFGIGTVSGKNVMRWDGSAWNAMGSGLDDVIYDFEVHAGELYAAGEFLLSGATAARCVAKWDGSTSTWSQVGTLDPLWNQVFALESHGGSLYAGGTFPGTVSGSTTLNGIARFDVTNDEWDPVDGGMIRAGGNGWVYDLLSYDGDLVAIGIFDKAGGLGGISANNIASWNGSTWSTFDSGLESFLPGYGTSGVCLAEYGSELYAGGSFAEAGGNESLGMAKWGGTTTSVDLTLGGGEDLEIGAAFPNPFRPRTTIRYSLPASANAKVTVHDVRGRTVATLLDVAQSAGEHSVRWDGRAGAGARVAPGVYFVRLESQGEVRTRKIVAAD